MPYGIRIRVSLFKVLLTVALLTAFVILGVWQLERAQEKTEIRERYEHLVDQPEVMVEATPLDAKSMIFRNAIASGRFVPEFQILLDNKVYQGRAGYHVLTPLLLIGSSTLLLVDRGWKPWGPDRQHIPQIDAPTQQVTVRGRLVELSQFAISFEKTQMTKFQQLWQNLEIQHYAELTGYTVQPLVLQLAPDDVQGDGFVREWPRYEDSWIQRHRAYALQWFSMAFVLLILFILLGFKRRT